MMPGAERIPINRRLHVLHVCVATHGAVATVVAGYVRDQVERGWNVTVICPSRGDLGYAAREAGATVRWWRAAAHESTLPGAAMRLRRLIADAAPDVVHLHGPKVGLIGRAIVRDRVPTVFQPHGWSFRGPLSGPAGVSPRWERFAVRWTTELVCGSTAERQLGENLGVRVPTTVIPPGIDLAEFAPVGERGRSRARELLGLVEAPTVVCVGPLLVRKGQQDLLTTWPQVRSAIPDARLILVGDGPDRSSLERLAAQTAGVSFVGARVDTALWMAAADVVAIPSRWESLTLVPLQAMACARSVVATDVPGVAETVPPPAGAVLPVEDSRAIAEALVDRLGDHALAEEEGWNGRSHVEAHHDLGRSARELARVYLRLVGTRRGRRPDRRGVAVPHPAAD